MGLSGAIPLILQEKGVSYTPIRAHRPVDVLLGVLAVLHALDGSKARTNTHPREIDRETAAGILWSSLIQKYH